MLRKCDVNLIYHLPHKTITEYGMDKSGRVSYQFNSLGFRGEEYNQNAKKLIYVGGCSYTVGTGLSVDDIWPYRFKELFVKKEKSAQEEINLLNFAVGGTSNDYITRILMTQSRQIKPDLIVVYFSHKNRGEYLIDDEVHLINIGSILKKENINNIPEPQLNYFNYYTDEMGFVNLMKNILLLQYFCKCNGIDYIFSLVDIKVLNDEEFTLNPICNQFIELVDKEYLCDFNLKRLDIAADNAHAGPKSHQHFAERLFKIYEERISNRQQ